MSMNKGNIDVRASLYGNGKDRGAQVHVVSDNDGSPVAFKAVLAKSKTRKLINFAGGCKGMDDATIAALFPFVTQALTRADGSKFAGIVMSGGTKDSKDMITQVPSYVAAQEGFDVIAVAHTPRTDVLSASGPRAELHLNDYGTTVDTGHHAILLRQASGNAGGDWNHDIAGIGGYRELMLQIQQEADGEVAQVVANGGDITRDDEIYDFLTGGIHVIVIAGSLREADAFVAAWNGGDWQNGDWSKTAAEMRAKKGDEKADAKIAECKKKLEGVDKSLVHIVKMGDVDALRAAFVAIGVL